MNTASLGGTEPQVLVIFLRLMFTDSMALVVEIILRMSAGKSKNGVRRLQLRRQDCSIGANDASHLPYFQPTKFRLSRTMWTKQRCTAVLGVDFYPILPPRISVSRANQHYSNHPELELRTETRC